MTDDLGQGPVSGGTLFAVHADPPWLLHLSGELDMDSAPALSAALEEPVRRGGTVGLNVAELSFIDSSGLNTILTANRLLGDRGRIVIFQPGPAIRRLIEITGLEGIINVAPGPAATYEGPRRNLPGR